MANIILPQVNILSEINDSTKLMVEQDGQINRYPIADLELGGGDVTIDLSSGTSSDANPINADTLNGYEFDYFASQSDLDNYATVEQVEEIIANLPEDVKIKLNYSIVGGTTQPSNPTQNMIWINTDTSIGKVFFTKDEPNEAFVNGDIWIATGNYSSVAFNALRVNNEYMNEVYPISAKQYVSGAWVNVTAKSYQGGEWVDWIVYLFNEGDFGVSGGWSVGNLNNPGYSNYGTATVTNESGILTFNGQKNNAWHNNPYDLTNISSVVICAKHNAYCEIAVIKTKVSGFSASARVVIGSADNVSSGSSVYNEYTIDVSGLSGEYYIVPMIYEYANPTIIQIKYIRLDK